MTAVMMTVPQFYSGWWLWASLGVTALVILGYYAVTIGPFLRWFVPVAARIATRASLAKRFALAIGVAYLLSVPLYASTVCCFECDWWMLIFWMCWAV